MREIYQSAKCIHQLPLLAALHANKTSSGGQNSSLTQSSEQSLYNQSPLQTHIFWQSYGHRVGPCNFWMQDGRAHSFEQFDSSKRPEQYGIIGGTDISWFWITANVRIQSTKKHEEKK